MCINVDSHKFSLLVFWPKSHLITIKPSQIDTVVVQSLRNVWLFIAEWTAAWKVSLVLSISQSLLKITSLESVMPFKLFPPLPFPSPPSSIFPSIRVVYNELALSIRWPKYGSFSFSISPSNEYSGLISFRIDWFDFLAVQRPLKSLLQHHSSKASIFFMISLTYGPNWKTCWTEEPGGLQSMKSYGSDTT